MIYFLHAPSVCRVKIGFSKKPEFRLEKMKPHSPVPMALLGTIDAGYYLERQLHTHFRPHHSHHEWFEATPDVMADIGALLAGTFNIAMLPSVALKAWVWEKRKAKYERAKAELTRLEATARPTPEAA